MFYKLKNDKRGMTLVEMVISLVILSILMTSTMGMITSSMSVFTSTSKAALDRMVGNSVYSTLESALKYSTHLTISNTPKTDTKSQSFFVSITDQDNSSGKLQYRRENSSYVSLYDDSFYGGRTIQYTVKEVGNDQKHVKIGVTVYRDGNAVYEKDAVIKCVNLSLIRSGTNANMINDTSSASDINQYLYFSVDEMLIAGGETAWSIEYKINEYMEKYNAILAEYYGKLCKADNPVDEALLSYSDTEGHRIQKDVLTTLVNNRQKAIFGDGTQNVSWEGDDSSTYCNLRSHYQDKIKDLLKFTPTHATSDSNNPYYNVVATKEELYTGFMLTYYDDNHDGKILKDEYPQFENPDTFFAGTTMKNYAGTNNGMTILCYFNDYLNDDYSQLFTTQNVQIVTYDQLGTAYDANTLHWVCNDPSVYGGTTSYCYPYSDTIANRLGGTGYSFRQAPGFGLDYTYYKYAADGTAYDADPTKVILGTYTSKNAMVKPSGYVAWDTAFASCRDRMNVVELDGNYGASSTSSATVGGTDGTKITITVTQDVPEGWYYFREGDGAGSFKGRHVIYLEATPNAVVNAYGQKIAVAKGKTIELLSYHYTARYYRYEQAQTMQSDGVNTVTNTVTLYNFKQHQYKDWTLYGVDWNSWFNTTQQGLLNSVIGGIAGWFTGQSNITSVSGENSDMSLGLTGKYNVNNIDTKLKSYNLAWIVYSTKRGTWYYLPDSSNRVSSAASGVTWVSNKNTPIPLDLKGWSSSSQMIKDIETRKLSNSGFFGLIDTTKDMIWVPLPTGGAIDRNEVVT